jgi:hypothetical protein
VDRGRIELPTPGFSVSCSRLLGNPLTHPGVKAPRVALRANAPPVGGARRHGRRPSKRGRPRLRRGTLRPPKAGRVGAGPTSLRISLRSPITTRLTSSHPILEDPGRQRREAHASAGVVAVEVARLGRLELPTHGLEGRCSIRLSYRRAQEFSLLAERPSSDAVRVSPEVRPARMAIRAVSAFRSSAPRCR